MMRRFRPTMELLEHRRVLATIAGGVAVDTNGNHVHDAADLPVASALVWQDANRNGQFDAGESFAFTDANGEYLLENVAPGESWIRVRLPLGMVQTFPYEHVTMQYDEVADSYRLVTLDSVTGQVFPLGSAAGVNRSGVIKTVAGEYFATGHLSDSLYRIDPETGQQTPIGEFDQQVVAGLAYDPLMDEIYTLARPTDDGEPVAPLRLYKVDRLTAALVPVSDIEPSIDGIEFTTSLAFDWVNRQIVLFDNGTDTAYAYDLQGEIHQLGTFAPQDFFFNLVFDGFRFLTHRTANGQTTLFEVDPVQGTLTEVVPLQQRLDTNSADRLAVGEPHRVEVPDADAALSGVDFLSTKLVVDTAELVLSADKAQLLSVTKNLDLTTDAVDAAVESRFCVAGSSHIDLELAGSATRSYQVDLGDATDTLALPQHAFVNWPNLHVDMGEGHDTLAIEAEEVLSLPALVGRIRDVDEVQLVGPQATTVELDAASISAISDANTLTVRMAPEDTISLADGPWSAEGAEVQNGQRMHVLATDQVILSIRNGTPWQNPVNRFDVNADGSVTPLDVLLVVNLINRRSASVLDEDEPFFRQAPYVDSNGDNTLSPIDVLLLVNRVNRGED
ncbi:MAG: hypothetical protein KatS3mg111_4392 [Pirellulaceae bacterium]|nr:MAG: hypothetical protein KatS3mg111_4392 [Pirellulaceae bacterium]